MSENNDAAFDKWRDDYAMKYEPTLTEADCHAAFNAGIAVGREQASQAVWVDYAALVPTSWLDPLLSGPDKVVGELPYDYQDIERILRATNARISAAMRLANGGEVEE